MHEINSKSVLAVRHLLQLHLIPEWVFMGACLGKASASELPSTGSIDGKLIVLPTPAGAALDAVSKPAGKASEAASPTGVGLTPQGTDSRSTASTSLDPVKDPYPVPTISPHSRRTSLNNQNARCAAPDTPRIFGNFHGYSACHMAVPRDQCGKDFLLACSRGMRHAPGA